MTLRRDHVAGGAMIAFGLAAYAISGDLPFGTLASPGPGMLPLLAIGLVVGLGAVLVVQAGQSPPFASIAWPDLAHAARIVLVTAVSLLLYERLGFLLTVSALLVVMLVVIERRPWLPALSYAVGVPLLAYLLLAKLLKSQIPIGILGF